MDRFLAKLKIFHDFMVSLRDVSNCKRARTSAIIIPSDFREVYAIGYNGPASGVNHDRCSAEEGSCGCVHAEANAVIKLKQKPDNWNLFSSIDADQSYVYRDGFIMLCTTAPCILCAGLIINCEAIDTVVYDESYRKDDGLTLLQHSRIEVVKYDSFFKQRSSDH